MLPESEETETVGCSTTGETTVNSIVFSTSNVTGHLVDNVDLSGV